MNILDSLPFVPTSVLKLERRKKTQDLRTKRRDGWGSDLYASNSSRNSKGNFRLELAEFVYKYYCRNKENIIFDPFSGWGERGFVAKNLGYKYIGYDISHEANRYALETYGVKNTLGDSREIELESDSVDFCFSCPPYFNLEKYESVEGQLTDIKNYEDFLIELMAVIKEIRRVLKEDSLCCFVVSDFRKEGIFYNFSWDVTKLFSISGFEVFDKVIVDKTIGYRIPLFLQQSYRLGYVIKTHEYLLIFR